MARVNRSVICPSLVSRNCSSVFFWVCSNPSRVIRCPRQVKNMPMAPATPAKINPRSVAENPGPRIVPKSSIKRRNCEYAANRDQHRKQSRDVCVCGDTRFGVVTVLHEAYPARHQRQVRDGGGHQELEERLGSTEVACLANAELHQPRQPVFGDLTQLAIWCELLASLEGPRLLQQGLLRVDHHQTTFAGARTYAQRSQRTAVADGGVEAKRSQGDARGTVALARTDGHHLPGLLAGGAGATHRLQIDPEVLFRELGPSAPAGHLGHQFPPGLGEGPSGVAVSVGAVSHRLLDRDAGVRLHLLDHLQRPLVVGCVARHDVRRRDQLALWVDSDLRLVPIEALARALATVAHFGVMHRYYAIPAHCLLEASTVFPALNVLREQPLQQDRRLAQAPASGIACGDSLQSRASRPE